MPFIVTTTHTVERREAFTGDEPPVPTRRAVATLEEARKACIKIVQPHAAAAAKGSAGGPVADICLSLMRKDWNGGTVGPLPDGTVIEVEPVTASDRRLWDALPTIVQARYGHRGNIRPSELISAFNAAQKPQSVRP